MAYSHRTKNGLRAGVRLRDGSPGQKMEWKRGEWSWARKVITFNAGRRDQGYDAATGKLGWQKSQSYPATSGILATAGGLVFYGDPEGNVNAVNDETGEHLWSFQVGSGCTAIRLPSPDRMASSTLPFVYGAGGGGIWPLFYGEYLKKNQKGGGLMVFTVE